MILRNKTTIGNAGNIILYNTALHVRNYLRNRITQEGKSRGNLA